MYSNPLRGWRVGTLQSIRVYKSASFGRISTAVGVVISFCWNFSREPSLPSHVSEEQAMDWGGQSGNKYRDSSPSTLSIDLSIRLRTYALPFTCALSIMPCLPRRPFPLQSPPRFPLPLPSRPKAPSSSASSTFTSPICLSPRTPTVFASTSATTLPSDPKIDPY